MNVQKRTINIVGVF